MKSHWVYVSVKLPNYLKIKKIYLFWGKNKRKKTIGTTALLKEDL